MWSALKWAIHAALYGKMLVNRRYTETYPLYVPNLPEPIIMQPGERIEIIHYPAGK